MVRQLVPFELTISNFLTFKLPFLGSSAHGRGSNGRVCHCARAETGPFQILLASLAPEDPLDTEKLKT